VQAEWQAHIDELLQELRGKQAQFKDLQEQMAALEATVTAEDDMISVTVNAQGQLKKLELDARIYRKLTPTELADVILLASREAAAQIGDRVRTAVQPLVPGEAGAGFDLDKIVPKHPEDFESLREKYGFRNK
jgi:DNA-binding protein YbaB